MNFQNIIPKWGEGGCSFDSPVLIPTSRVRIARDLSSRRTLLFLLNIIFNFYTKQECIPVGCVPAER